jgi:hypothetical protein
MKASGLGMHAEAHPKGAIMRIRVVVTLAALVALLLLPAAAAARDQQAKVVTMRAPASHAPLARPHHSQRPATLAGRVERDGQEAAASDSRIPERAAAGGTCTVTGTVLGYDGSPEAKADVQWTYYDASDNYVRGTWAQTDAAGKFSFSDVAISNQGRLTAWLSDDKTKFRRGRLDFAAGANDYVLRPGALTVQATRSSDPDWNDWTTMDTDFYGAGNAAAGEIAGSSGQAYAMAPNVDYGIVSFWNNEAVEWQTTSPIPIVTGALSANTVAVNEADALQVYVGKPYWASGKPGAKIGYDLTNWPAGYKATLAGYSEDPDRDISVQYSGEWTSTGGAGRVALAVPKQATPGYAFDIEAHRSDGLWPVSDLYIYDGYQVCTMKPSKTSVRRGTKIRATGVVPTAGHWGSQAGLKKVVTLYAHKGTAVVPTVWNPAKKGWVKIGSAKTNGLGAYKTPYFRPLKTLTIVVRYPGDDWYWDAYTSVQKITVK